MNRRPLTLLALLVAAFAISLDATIVNIALPTLARDLHASNSQLQWIVDAYSLVFAALLLASGSLSDRIGRKGMLLSGLVVFALGAVAGGLMHTATHLIIARGVMGLGAAMVFPATLSLISNIYTERTERARAIGLWGATTGIAIALGPIAGGGLLESFSWSSIFFAMAPIALLGMVLVAFAVPTSRDPHAPKIDRVGFVLATTAIALTIFTLIEAPNHGWVSTRSLAGFGVAVVLLSCFIAWERRVPAPMLDISLFRNLRFTAASGSVTIAFFALSGFIFLMTQFFQLFKGYGPLSAGVHMLPVAVSVGVASVIGVKLAVRFGTKLVVTAGLFMMTCFYIWVSGANATLAYWIIALQMILFGAGMGLTSAPATEAIMGVVPTHKAGVGSAVNDTTRILGSTLGVAVIGSIYASLYSGRVGPLLPSVLPVQLAHAAHSSAAAALRISVLAKHYGYPEVAHGIHHAALVAFFDGFRIATLVAGGVVAAGVIMAASLLPAQPGRTGEETSHEEVGQHAPQSAPAIAE